MVTNLGSKHFSLVFHDPAQPATLFPDVPLNAPFYGPLAILPNSIPYLLSSGDIAFNHRGIALAYKCKGYGAISKVWNIITDHGHDGAQHLLAKTVVLASLGAPGHSSGDHLRRAFAAEALAYKAMQDIQGIVVPTYHGMYGSVQGKRHEMWCAMMEDVGYALPRRCKLNIKVRRQAHKLLDQVHGCGLLHGDIEWRHLVWKDTIESMRIIDFDQATQQTDDNRAQWLVDADLEKIALDRVFRYEP